MDQIVVAVSALPTFDVPVPQTVDQLVGALLHLDTPIPEQWKRQLSCLSWRFLSSPLTFQFALGAVLVDVFKVLSLARVPRLWSKDFHPGQSSTVEQIVDIPVPLGGRHLQDPGLASFPQEVDGAAFQGFFSFFPAEKGARLGPHSGSELSADFTSSTPPAQQQSTSPAMERETWVNGDDVWVRVDTL